MRPSNTDSPLRRSEVRTVREISLHPSINDDEEERRQARRRTLANNTGATDSSTLEQSENLQVMLEMYNGNKLSRDNAWSLSLIDMLSKMLDKHHKSLNNFKVAGSSLEASSKLYGLRVDSVHTDVLRMSAGLNAQKFSERNDGDDDDVATGGDEATNPNSSAAGVEGGANAPTQKSAKPKRPRKAVSTITKNKETINARLDTVPLQDPVFGKLNSIVGSINSSNRLMNNMLLTADSELRLRTTFNFWNALELEPCDYTEAPSELIEVMDGAEGNNVEAPVKDSAPCDQLLAVLRYPNLQLRPLHAGYIISDTPEVIADNDRERRLSTSWDADNSGGGGVGGDAEIFHNTKEIDMAFDMDAECEPLQTHMQPVVDIDYAELDDLTIEERGAIAKCRGLQRAPLLIDDLRPVDASSKLEYSYRPMDKISQFWAGPSHWKFKRNTRMGHSLLAGPQADEASAVPRTAYRRRAQRHDARQRCKPLQFGEFHDEMFLKLDKNWRGRKVNFQKKWDHRKLKLPTDLKFDSSIFYKYTFAPGLSKDTVVCDDEDGVSQPRLHTAASSDTDHDMHHGDDDDSHSDSQQANHYPENMGDEDGMMCTSTDQQPGEAADVTDGDNVGDNTVLEIATQFEGAPSQVTKIIVPFAKRAKVIDMKNLKRCCTQIINKQLRRPLVDNTCQPAAVLAHPLGFEENYSTGQASFKEIYRQLPALLTPAMSEALSPAVAFYSVLHLANDLSYRLIPQEDLDDFKIRQVIDIPEDVPPQ